MHWSDVLIDGSSLALLGSSHWAPCFLLLLVVLLSTQAPSHA